MLYALNAVAIVDTDGSTQDIKDALDSCTEAFPQVVFASAQIDTIDGPEQVLVQGLVDGLNLLKSRTSDEVDEEYPGQWDEDEVEDFNCGDPTCEVCGS